MKEYKKVKFNKIFSKIDYVKNEKTNKFERKMTFIPKKGEGFIIGDCYKYEGTYIKSRTSGMYCDDYDPAYLTDRKRVNLYHVLCEYNNTVLVKKEDAKEIK